MSQLSFELLKLPVFSTIRCRNGSVMSSIVQLFTLTQSHACYTFRPKASLITLTVRRLWSDICLSGVIDASAGRLIALPNKLTVFNCVFAGEFGMICTESLCGLINDVQTAQTEPVLPALRLRVSTPQREKRTAGAVSADPIQYDGQLPHWCSPARSLGSIGSAYVSAQL